MFSRLAAEEYEFYQSDAHVLPEFGYSDSDYDKLSVVYVHAMVVLLLCNSRMDRVSDIVMAGIGLQQ